MMCLEMKYSRCLGLSLVELLISLAVGLMLLSSVLGIFGATIKSEGDNLRATRLNQEVRRIMDVIDRDIRRAGYWALAAHAYRTSGELVPSSTTGSITLTSSKADFAPFGSGIVGRTILSSIDGGKALITRYISDNKVEADVISNFASTKPHAPAWWIISNPFFDKENNLQINATGTCIQYSYDINKDSIVNDNERFAYKLHNSRINMHQGGSVNCTTGVGNWVDLSDSNIIVVNSFSVSLSKFQCINVSVSPNSDCNPSSATYVAPVAGNVLVWIRSADVAISASLTADQAVTHSIVQTIRIRNDAVYIN